MFFYELTRIPNSNSIEKPSLFNTAFYPTIYARGGKVNRSSISSFFFFFSSLKLRIPSAQRSLELSGMK